MYLVIIARNLKGFSLINILRTNYIYIILFFISNFFLLVNYEGLYWDDWTLYNQDRRVLVVLFDMLHHDLKGDFYLIISKFFNHIYLFRIFVFISYLLIAYFTYKVLSSTKLFNKFENKLISFVSIIIPIHTSITLISINIFLFPVLLFYSAFFLLTKYYQSNSIYLKIIILYLFFLSFSTNSLLVFYGIVLVYLFYMDNNQVIKVNCKTIKIYIVKRVDFLLLPIIYFIYKKTFLVPYDLYANYNQISIKNLLNIGNILVQTYEAMTIEMLVYLLSNIYVICISALLAFFVSIKINIKEPIFNNKIILLFGLSAILFILAVFPYAAVNKLPVIENANGRFSLLLGISLALTFIGFSASLSKVFYGYKNKVFVFIMSFIIILMVAKNVEQQYKLNLDWFYKVSLIENFKQNKVIRDNTTFVINNYLYKKLVFKSMGYYDWTGMLKKAFGDTKRLMITPSGKKKFPTAYLKLRVYKHYNSFEWNGNLNFIEVNVKENIPLSPKIQAKLFLYYIFNYEKFLGLAKDLTIVSIKP